MMFMHLKPQQLQLGIFEGVKGFQYDGDVQGIWYCIQNTGAL